MSKFTRRLIVGALVVSAAALGASPANAAKGGTDRPFSASGNGTNIFEDVEDCDFVITDRGPAFICDQTIELDFSGTHLGKSTNSSTGILTLYVGEPCTTPGGGPGIVFESSQAVTIIAANGDTLTADTNVSGCGDGESEAVPEGTYTFTGGTGRFADASGQGTTTSLADGTALSSEWSGTISY